VQPIAPTPLVTLPSTTPVFMAPLLNSATLADTILASATDGYYPDSEDIASAELTTSHLPIIIRNLEAANNNVKVSP
jgi:hypothetical protein